MRYVAAALLVALGGGEVSEANIKKLLDGVGIDCDSEKAAIIVKELAGKNLEELIAEGNGKLASVPSGGAAAPAAAGAAPAAAAELPASVAGACCLLGGALLSWRQKPRARAEPRWPCRKGKHVRAWILRSP